MLHSSFQNIIWHNLLRKAISICTVLHLRLVEVYIGLRQRWGLEDLQKKAHHLPHVIFEALKACSRVQQLSTLVGISHHAVG